MKQEVLEAMVDELFPKVCRILNVAPDSIEKPGVMMIEYPLTDVYGALNYYSGGNKIVVDKNIRVDRGQMAHEVAEAVAFLSPDIENFTEDLAREVEREISHTRVGD